MYCIEPCTSKSGSESQPQLSTVVRFRKGAEERFMVLHQKGHESRMYALGLLHRGQKLTALTNSPGGSSLSDDPGDLPVNRLDFLDSARSRMLDLPRTEKIDP